MSLPHDTARCEGSGCVVRGQCLRYIERADKGPNTPTYTRLTSVYPCPLYRAGPNQSLIATNKTGA